MSFANLYARFRGSTAFLAALAATITVWIGWNEMPGLPHFDDPEFGRLNLLLSTEASLSVALLIMANDKQNRAQQEILRQLLRLTETIKTEVEDI